MSLIYHSDFHDNAVANFFALFIIKGLTADFDINFGQNLPKANGLHLILPLTKR